MTITVLASLRSDRDRLRAGITDRLHFGIADRLRRNPHVAPQRSRKDAKALGGLELLLLSAATYKPYSCQFCRQVRTQNYFRTNARSDPVCAGAASPGILRLNLRAEDGVCYAMINNPGGFTQ